MAHSKEKTEQFNMRVSEYDLARLQVVINHLDGKHGWLSNKRPDAIWAAVKLYIEHHGLKEW